MGRILRIALVASMALGASPAAAAAPMAITYSLPSGGLYSIGFDHVVGTRTVGYPLYFEYPGSTFNNNPVMPSPVAVTPTGTQVRMEIYSRCKLSTPGNYKACTSGTYRYEPTLGDSAVALRIAVRSQVNIGRIVFPNGHETYAARLRATVRSRTPLANSAVGAITLVTAGFCSSGIFGMEGVCTKLKYQRMPIHMTPHSTCSQRTKEAPQS